MKRILFQFIIILLISNVQAQNIKLSKSPENYQLYARDKNNLAKVILAGDVINENFQTIELKTFRDGQLLASITEDLKYSKDGVAAFSIQQEIEAGLFQYKFQLSLANDKLITDCFLVDSVVCGDAYIITGQSNSHASSSLFTDSSPYCRSFGVKTGYNAYTSEHHKYRWGEATGNCPGLAGIGGWHTDNPYGVGAWGKRLMDLIVDTYKIPVCIINGGSGGSSIEKNMPSPYQADLETSFGRLIYRVKEAGLTNGIKAILWHQGESNTNQEYKKYPEYFDILYKSWKNNFPSLEKVYLFQLHPGCGGEFQSELRDLQKKISDKYEDVEIMSTCGLPGHDGCHFNHEGYVAMAESVFPLLARDIYGELNSKSITPPKVRRAYIGDLKDSVICIEFDQDVVWKEEQEDQNKISFPEFEFYSNKNYISTKANKEQVRIKEINVKSNKLYINVEGDRNYQRISYVPDHFYSDTSICYNGPWVYGANGIGALSFDRLDVDAIGSDYKSVPRELQLFPRDKNDEAVLTVEGSLYTLGFDKAICKLYRNNILYKQSEQDLKYSNGEAKFSFNPKIFAELAEYKIEIGFLFKGKYYQDKVVNNIVCGDVYLINGQSNSHPTRKESIYRNEYCRSFGSNTGYSAYNPADTTWGLAAGDVSRQYHVGAWGISLMQQIVEKYKIPICIINGGSGGSKIEYNLPMDNRTDLNSTYNRLLYRAEKAGVRSHVKAIFWHQGESDTRGDDYLSYASSFDILYNAWKEDFPSLAKVFVFQLRPGCNVGKDRQSEMREIQRQFVNKYNDVEVMSTCGLPGHDGCHYSNEGYIKMAEWIFSLVAKSFYDIPSEKKIGAANITESYYIPKSKEICLVFNHKILWEDKPFDGYYLKDQFFLDGESGKIESGRAKGNKIYLKLKEPISAKKISYLPGYFYEGTENCYQGPWLFGQNGVGALSFHNYIIRGL
jgi:lysophospholipase L1-like esterase